MVNSLFIVIGLIIYSQQSQANLSIVRWEYP